MQQRPRSSTESAGGSAGRAAGSPRKTNRRVALAPHKAKIRGWVAQGRSDAWIAGALGTTSSSVQTFRSRHGIHRRAPERREPARPEASRPEAAETRSAEPEAATEAEAPEGSETSVFEGVLEHGEQTGHGLWLDPAVADDPVFQRVFAGVSDVRVSVEEGRIVLTPASRNATTDGGGVAVEDAEQLQPGLTDFAEAAKAVPASNREYGTLKWFGLDKGFGFIIRKSGEEIFVHKSQLKTELELAPGTRVSYEVSSNQRGLMAVDVRAGC